MRSTIGFVCAVSMAAGLIAACNKAGSGTGDASPADLSYADASDVSSSEAPSDVGLGADEVMESDGHDSRTGVCGCGLAPLCGQSCKGPCGCCPCADGDTLEINGETYHCSADMTCFEQASSVDASGN